MTRRIFVTRADGSPAYLNAPPRKRQSHIDLQNAINKRRAEFEALRPEGEPRFITGVCFVSMAAMLFLAVWAMFS